MTESLAIISGKGGSGKTTLAISLAQLLATCEKRVLLVDCDMSTHGATYFFEGHLTQKRKYVTFVDFINGEHFKENSNVKKEILQVSPNIEFIPSCVDFPSKSFSYEKMNKMMLHNFDELIHSDAPYDIVIFDCQAGYSTATDAVTKFAKKKLAVTEADAISASSLRVLYSQLSEQLDNGQTYQIFNKITKEEQDVYSKLTHGTLFTNLTPILFDWNVRKAFITNDLPNIDASNPSLTNSIYDLAIALFPSYKKELRKFIINVKEKMLSTLESKRLEIKYERNRKKSSYMFDLVIPIITSIITAIPLFYIIVERPSFFDDSTFSSALVGAVIASIVVSFIWMFIKRHSDVGNRKKRFMLQKEEQLKEEIYQLQSTLDFNHHS